MATAQNSPKASFDHIEYCSSDGRRTHTIAADLNGTLLRGRSSFPYFLLVALEAGSLLRAILFGLLAPLMWLLYNLVSESAAIKLMIYVAFAGLKVNEIERVAKAVLPKFYSEDVHSETYRVFSACGKRYVVTANPRIMVEHFCMNVLGANKVIGTEIQITRQGRATGFVKSPGVLLGQNKRSALKHEFADEKLPEVGVGHRNSDYPFMSLCQEGYLVPGKNVEPVDKNSLVHRVIFHDGRLVQLPTPFNALVTFLWLPFGFALAVLRLVFGVCVSRQHLKTSCTVLGVRRVVKGKVPASTTGVLFVCNHRTLADPIFVGIAAERNVIALTYSLSRVSELVSPFGTVRLSRDKEKDALKMKRLLESGKDICLCPEGTTCREPFLLRFSALFTELTDCIVPVAVKTRQSMFHGTTVRGWKGMDSFFFMMNPFPKYEIEFVEQLPAEMSVGKGGKSPIEVANCIQRMIGEKLGYECTNFTRKDKYLMLSGTDVNSIEGDVVRRMITNGVHICHSTATKSLSLPPPTSQQAFVDSVKPCRVCFIPVNVENCQVSLGQISRHAAR